MSWWACVMGVVKYNQPYFGPFVMSLFIFFHLLMIKNKKKEILFLSIAGIIGFFVDSFKAFSGFITYNGVFSDNLAPLWIIAMWIGFAATINHSGSWIKKRYLIAILLGAIFGPLNYLVGDNMDALSINMNFSQNILVLSFVWGVSVPFLYYLAEKINPINK